MVSFSGRLPLTETFWCSLNFFLLQNLWFFCSTQRGSSPFFCLFCLSHGCQELTTVTSSVVKLREPHDTEKPHGP